MAQKKVRLTDNDPLESKSDSVLSTYSDFNSANTLTSEHASLPEDSENKKSTSQQFRSLAGQLEDQSRAKPIQIKKVTYQLDSRLVEQLDRVHLQLCLERGKSSTPYKEVLVETAIATFLEQFLENPNLLEEAIARQERRLS
ncbi:hypothetical protein H6G45_00770 [Synechocystis sp. FACHB-383]|uniref:hypothetical protein n=1 Tax=Synechocystis sp. FACHB-383 TaxID=2692864 RepID=UPI0016855DF7|nr:hypothetical protein [Synechocystis sp. FACHB-383]MBD2652046.1 hypothetical protein [Synechocystis sp. FACHB-383]